MKMMIIETEFKSCTIHWKIQKHQTKKQMTMTFFSARDKLPEKVNTGPRPKLCLESYHTDFKYH